ncbi:unnamed protein product [Gordionus sp. m RMFG-2023]|uniref:uncharacterized protein LOC135926637 n=1 Tax=Gordionus sp. m RMFG-2023 TaxID=3053472 RepID=UPI0030E2417A
MGENKDGNKNRINDTNSDEDLEIVNQFFKILIWVLLMLLIFLKWIFVSSTSIGGALYYYSLCSISSNKNNNKMPKNQPKLSVDSKETDYSKSNQNPSVNTGDKYNNTLFRPNIHIDLEGKNSLLLLKEKVLLAKNTNGSRSYKEYESHDSSLSKGKNNDVTTLIDPDLPQKTLMRLVYDEDDNDILDRKKPEISWGKSLRNDTRGIKLPKFSDLITSSNTLDTSIIFNDYEEVDKNSQRREDDIPIVPTRLTAHDMMRNYYEEFNPLSKSRSFISPKGVFRPINSKPVSYFIPFNELSVFSGVRSEPLTFNTEDQLLVDNKPNHSLFEKTSSRENEIYQHQSSLPYVHSTPTATFISQNIANDNLSPDFSLPVSNSGSADILTLNSSCFDKVNRLPTFIASPIHSCESSTQPRAKLTYHTDYPEKFCHNKEYNVFRHRPTSTNYRKNKNNISFRENTVKTFSTLNNQVNQVIDILPTKQRKAEFLDNFALEERRGSLVKNFEEVKPSIVSLIPRFTDINFQKGGESIRALTSNKNQIHTNSLQISPNSTFNSTSLGKDDDRNNNFIDRKFGLEITEIKENEPSTIYNENHDILNSPDYSLSRDNISTNANSKSSKRTQLNIEISPSKRTQLNIEISPPKSSKLCENINISTSESIKKYNFDQKSSNDNFPYPQNSQDIRIDSISQKPREYEIEVLSEAQCRPLYTSKSNSYFEKDNSPNSANGDNSLHDKTDKFCAYARVRAIGQNPFLALARATAHATTISSAKAAFQTTTMKFGEEKNDILNHPLPNGKGFSEEQEILSSNIVGQENHKSEDEMDIHCRTLNKDAPEFHGSLTNGELPDSDHHSTTLFSIKVSTSCIIKNLNQASTRLTRGENKVKTYALAIEKSLEASRYDPNKLKENTPSPALSNCEQISSLQKSLVDDDYDNDSKVLTDSQMNYNIYDKIIKTKTDIDEESILLNDSPFEKEIQKMKEEERFYAVTAYDIEFLEEQDGPNLVSLMSTLVSNNENGEHDPHHSLKKETPLFLPPDIIPHKHLKPILINHKNNVLKTPVKNDFFNDAVPKDMINETTFNLNSKSGIINVLPRIKKITLSNDVIEHQVPYEDRAGHWLPGPEEDSDEDDVICRSKVVRTTIDHRGKLPTKTQIKLISPSINSKEDSHHYDKGIPDRINKVGLSVRPENDKILSNPTYEQSKSKESDTMVNVDANYINVDVKSSITISANTIKSADEDICIKPETIETGDKEKINTLKGDKDTIKDSNGDKDKIKNLNILVDSFNVASSNDRKRFVSSKFASFISRSGPYYKDTTKNNSLTKIWDKIPSKMNRSLVPDKNIVPTRNLACKQDLNHKTTDHCKTINNASCKVSKGDNIEKISSDISDHSDNINFNKSSTCIFKPPPLPNFIINKSEVLKELTLLTNDNHINTITSSDKPKMTKNAFKKFNGVKIQQTEEKEAALSFDHSISSKAALTDIKSSMDNVSPSKALINRLRHKYINHQSLAQEFKDNATNAVDKKFEFALNKFKKSSNLQTGRGKTLLNASDPSKLQQHPVLTKLISKSMCDISRNLLNEESLPGKLIVPYNPKMSKANELFDSMMKDSIKRLLPSKNHMDKYLINCQENMSKQRSISAGNVLLLNYNSEKDKIDQEIKNNFTKYNFKRSNLDISSYHRAKNDLGSQVLVAETNIDEIFCNMNHETHDFKYKSLMSLDTTDELNYSRKNVRLESNPLTDSNFSDGIRDMVERTTSNLNIPRWLSTLSLKSNSTTNDSFQTSDIKSPFKRMNLEGYKSGDYRKFEESSTENVNHHDTLSNYSSLDVSKNSSFFNIEAYHNTSFDKTDKVKGDYKYFDRCCLARQTVPKYFTPSTLNESLNKHYNDDNKNLIPMYEQSIEVNTNKNHLSEDCNMMVTKLKDSNQYNNHIEICRNDVSVNAIQTILDSKSLPTISQSDCDYQNLEDSFVLILSHDVSDSSNASSSERIKNDISVNNISLQDDDLLHHHMVDRKVSSDTKKKIWNSNRHQKIKTETLVQLNSRDKSQIYSGDHKSKEDFTRFQEDNSQSSVVSQNNSLLNGSLKNNINPLAAHSMTSPQKISAYKSIWSKAKLLKHRSKNDDKMAKENVLNGQLRPIKLTLGEKDQISYYDTKNLYPDIMYIREEYTPSNSPILPEEYQSFPVVVYPNHISNHSNFDDNNHIKFFQNDKPNIQPNGNVLYHNLICNGKNSHLSTESSGCELDYSADSQIDTLENGIMNPDIFVEKIIPANHNFSEIEYYNVLSDDNLYNDTLSHRKDFVKDPIEYYDLTNSRHETAV